MTVRTERDQKLAELKARTMSRMVGRALSPKTNGLDGLAKKLVANKVGPVEHDPDLDHDDFDLGDDGLRLDVP